MIFGNLLYSDTVLSILINKKINKKTLKDAMESWRGSGV
jgi:hypothetical protein